MAYDLIGEDAAIRISLGQTADGTLPVYGTATAIEGICRRIGVRGTVESTNTKAIGNARKKFRFHSAESRLEIENFVPNTGWSTYNTVTPEGRYMKVELKELDSMSAYKVWEGGCLEFNGDINVADAQVERIVVLCDADHA